MAMLQSFDIKTLADVRRFPGSLKFPQFDQENLAVSLRENNIRYMPMKNLGGRRKVHKDSKNTRWRNASFRGYADYMETGEFVQGVEALAAIALEWPAAYMCAEAVWWRCHRALISDYLKAKGWTVLHIMDVGKAEEHSYTSPATVIGDRVSYADEDLFNQ
ncbi:DUF488 domain-containing protein [Parapedobacter lycopersici]|uniref:DUF488 domain-containing protein n=1 Tax=Parapedobacter lycopersici TaxID=1864939 RepID=UPI00214D70B9|nr:DUF488 domain-containing protein [Parapedobacter lycopersici]